MGDDFWHMHHYCYALRDLRRAELAGPGTPRGRAFVHQATNDLDYVIRNCAPTMPLMPEFYLQLGIARLHQGKLIEAKTAFENSRRIKPDYWPPYARWADVLVGLKQFDQARQLLEAGLAHDPGNPELSKRLSSVDGLQRTRARAHGAKPPAPTSPARTASASAR